MSFGHVAPVQGRGTLIPVYAWERQATWPVVENGTREEGTEIHC